jgi:hypothetical protein
MIASEWNALQSPNNKVLGYNGVLNRDDEIGLPSPSAIGDMAAWYDATDFGSMVMDASANVSLLSDVSGQSGAVSGDSYLELPGTSGAYASTPSAAVLDITGDIDLRADASLDDWTPLNTMGLVVKDDSTGDRPYSFYVSSNGKLSFFGYNTATFYAASSSVATGFTDFSRHWVRVTRTAATGVFNFYTSTDGVVWTQLGDADVSGNSGNLAVTTEILCVGSNSNGTSLLLAGKIYQAQVYDGIDGTLVFDADFTNRGASNQSFPESSPNAALVTINGSARITHLDTENCLVLPGVSGNYASSPDSAAVSITGDIDIRAEIRLASWASGGDTFPIAKFDTTSQLSYYLAVRGSGLLRFSVSPDGTNINAINSDSTAVTGYLAGDTGWIRATRVASSGLVTFYTSSNGIDWTQLGDTVANTSGAIYNTTSTLNLGTWGSGTAGTSPLAIYQAQIYNGIDGTLAFDADFTGVAKLATSFTESSSNAATVTINSTAIALPARIHGARDLYMGTAASQPKYLGHSGTNYGYLNGVAGNYFITPSAPGNRITGNIEIVTHNKLDDWSSVTQSLFTKLQNSGQYCYQLYLTSGGFPIFRYSTNGTALVSATSSNGVPFSNGAEGWLKVSYDATSGDTKFYQGTDGTNWTQLGTTQTIASGAIFDGTDSVTVGTFVGLGYYASVANAISGTPLTSNATPTQVFQASDYPLSGGSTFFDGASTPALVLDGTSGNYASAPDSAAVSVTGDAEWEFDLALDDYSPTATNYLAAKEGSAGNRSWDVNIAQPSGLVVLRWTEDGSTFKTAASTAPIGVADGTRHTLTVTLDVDNGAVGNDVNFYVDGVQLGATTTTAGVTSIFDSTADLTVGSGASGTNPTSGNLYNFKFYNGIAGTLAFDADFSAQGSNTTSFTESSANAATVTLNGNAHIGPRWTINGGATIVDRTGLYFDGTADYMKSAPFSLSQPENIYLVGKQVTWTVNDTFLSGFSNGSMNIGQSPSTPNIVLYAGSVAAQNGTLALKTSAVLTAIFNAASSALGINRGTRTTGNPGAANGGGLTVGSNGGGASPANIFASEVLIYDTTAHDTNTQDRLVRYLARKGSIDV